MVNDELDAFFEGRICIDYPYENVLFRYDTDTKQQFRKFYGSQTEAEIPSNSGLFRDALRSGTAISMQEYIDGKPS